ncbi:MAG: transposase [Verrucomicrobiota bacterium]
MFFDPDKPIEKHRINLPHWQQDDPWIFLTWRLADSLPKTVVEKISSERETWEKAHPKPWDAAALKEYNRLFTLHFESLLDDCHGSCCLRDPAARRVVGGALHHFDGSRYALDSFVVMPNHVHVLFRISEGHHLQDIVHSWKSFSAHGINKALGQTGALWQREYWDRLIRSQKHFDWTRNYILKNPAKLSEGCYELYVA